MQVYVYGTGRYAANFLNYVGEFRDEIVGFIETKKSKNIFAGKPVYVLSEVDKYDLIIVASQFVYEIKENLYRNNFNFDKIIFLARVWIPADVSDRGIVYQFDKAQNKPTKSAVFFELSSIYTTSKRISDKIQSQINSSELWNGITEYNTEIHAPHISAQQRDMLDRCFVPKLDLNDYICDIGCASGEFSRYISPYVKSIDGFDVSESLINTAKKYKRNYGFDNINYVCANALDIEFNKKYNHGLMLGIGIYIQKIDIDMLIKKLSRAVESGGYIAVRDTLSMYTDSTIYMVRKEKGNLFEEYTAIYIPMKEYERLYLDNGFRIVEERYFCSYFHEPIEIGVHGYIFEKI